MLISSPYVILRPDYGILRILEKVGCIVGVLSVSWTILSPFKSGSQWFTNNYGQTLHLWTLITWRTWHQWAKSKEWTDLRLFIPFYMAKFCHVEMADIVI